MLTLLALGHTNHEIAKQLFISVRTAEAHRAHIMKKLEPREPRRARPLRDRERPPPDLNVERSLPRLGYRLDDACHEGNGLGSSRGPAACRTVPGRTGLHPVCRLGIRAEKKRRSHATAPRSCKHLRRWPQSRALVLAGPSFGAVTPRLVVSSTVAGPGQTLIIDASKQKADDPLARIQFFVPTGFALNSPAPGATVGNASAASCCATSTRAPRRSCAARSPRSRRRTPRSPGRGANCDTSQHLAAWMVQVSGSKGSFGFPVYVDATELGRRHLLLRPLRARGVLPLRRPRGERPEPLGEGSRDPVVQPRSHPLRAPDDLRRLPLALALDTLHARARPR